MSDEKESRIRDRAYDKWVSEGRPDGHHDRHWQEAATELAGELPDSETSLSSSEDSPVLQSQNGVDDAGGPAEPGTLSPEKITAESLAAEAGTAPTNIASARGKRSRS